MAWGMVSHGVRDYDAWKVVFDEHGTVRKEYGCTGGYVFRGVDDPNQITVLMEYPSAERFQAFAADPALAEAMQRGGVEGPPDVRLLELADRPAF